MDLAGLFSLTPSMLSLILILWDVLWLSSGDLGVLGVALVLGHLGLDVVGDAPLQRRVHQSIVEARPVDVEVEVVVDVLYVSAGHLEHGQADDLVVGGSEPLPVDVLQVPLLHLQVQVDPERPQVRDLLGHIPVEVLDLLLVGVLLRPAVLDEVVVDPVLQGDRVGHGGFLALVDGVEHFEHLVAHQLIVAIYKKADLVGFAVLGDGHVDVGHGGHLLLVGDEHHLLCEVGRTALEEVLDEGGGVVGGVVVDDHHPVVVVVLVEDRLQVELVPEVLGVVEGGHHDAEGQLCGVLAHVVGALQPVRLLPQLLRYLLLLHRVHEGRLDVVALQYPRVAPLLRLEVLPLRDLVELGDLGLSHRLLGVVLEQVQHHRLLPYGRLHELDALGDGHVALGPTLLSRLLLLGLPQHLLQVLDPFVEPREQFHLDLLVLVLFVVDLLVDGVDLPRQQLYLLLGLVEDELEGRVVALDAEQFEAQQDDEGDDAAESHQLHLVLGGLLAEEVLGAEVVELQHTGIIIQLKTGEGTLKCVLKTFSIFLHLTAQKRPQLYTMKTRAMSSQFDLVL